MIIWCNTPLWKRYKMTEIYVYMEMCVHANSGTWIGPPILLTETNIIRKFRFMSIETTESLCTHGFTLTNENCYQTRYRFPTQREDPDHRISTIKIFTFKNILYYSSNSRSTVSSAWIEGQNGPRFLYSSAIFEFIELLLSVIILTLSGCLETLQNAEFSLGPSGLQTSRGLS